MRSRQILPGPSRHEIERHARGEPPLHGRAGCETLYEDAARNVTEAPIRSLDDLHLKMRLRRVARRAWDDYAHAHGEEHFSPDFADGFRAGFADYLYEGGPGLPPAVPPFPYQLRHYETPAGHLAIDQWYAGFALGFDVARASGLRENIVIPLSQPPINAVPRPGQSAHVADSGHRRAPG